MLWFGWMDAGIMWSAASQRLMREAEERLITAALPSIKAGDPVLLRMPQATPLHTKGTWSVLTLETLQRQDQRMTVAWAGITSPPDSLAVGDAALPLPAIQLTIRNHRGHPVAGVQLIPDGMFTLGEIRAALRASFESRIRRPGRYVVLASARRPLPELRQHRRSAVSWHQAVFRCDNPTCPSRKQEVVVLVGPNAAGRAGVGTVAYPCPSCHGNWRERWALTWLRPLRPDDATRYPVVEFQVPPTQVRLSSFPGPMATVVRFPQSTLPCEWTGPTIRRLPSPLNRALKAGTPSALCATLRQDPRLGGALLSGLLTAENFRALVAHIRRLPPHQRQGGLATAMAFGFFPRRPTEYSLAQDAIQGAHHFYIAYDPEHFLHQLQFYGVMRHTGSFLDVGCGVGEKVFLAYALGAFRQCDGLEYDQRTAAVASFLLQRIATPDPYPINTYQADALTFSDYGNYDVIYMFRPFREANGMRQLWRHIAANMKLGAIAFDVHSSCCGLLKQDTTRFLTIRPQPNSQAGCWDIPISVDGFLEKMYL